MASPKTWRVRWSCFFIENLIKNERGQEPGLDRVINIERTHRALGPRPPAGVPPRSTVVRFLRFSEKEDILRAAWKKGVCIKNKQVCFNHDYALEVQKKKTRIYSNQKNTEGKGNLLPDSTQQDESVLFNRQRPL